MSLEPSPATQSSPARTSAPYKVLVVTASILFIAVLAIGAAISILISSHTGSRWLIDRALGIVNQGNSQVTYGSLEGNLLWGINAQNIRIQTPDMSMNVQRLRSSWQPLTLLNRQLTFTSIRGESVAVDWHSPASQAGTTPSGLPDFPFKISARNIRANDMTLTVDGQLYTLASAQLSATFAQRELMLDSFRFANDLGDVSGNLRIGQGLEGALDWRYTAPIMNGIDGARGSLRIVGSLENLAVQHELLEPFNVSSVGSLSLGATPNIQLTHILQSSNVDSAQWMGMAFSPTSVSILTESDFESVQVMGAVQGELISQDPAFSSQTVDLQLSAQLDRDGASMSMLDLSTSTGRLQASGSFQWSDIPRLALDFEIDESSPTSYSPAIAAMLALEQLHATGQIQWTQTAESWNSTLSFDELSAQLNDYPLTADGIVTLTPSGIVITEGRISNAENRLILNGSWSEAIDMTWRLDANSLDSLSDQLAGTVSGEGHISGTIDSPALNMNATGSNVTYAGNSIGKLQLTAQYSDDNQITLVLENIKLPSEAAPAIHTLTLDLSGQLDEHALQFHANTELGQLDFSLAGMLAPTQNWQWDGQLVEASIDTPIGPWAMNQAVDLAMNTNQASIAQSCWQQVQIILCAEGQWELSSGLQANLSLQGFDLAQFNSPNGSASPAPDWLPHLTTGNLLEGQLTANATISGPSTLNLSELSVTASIDAGAGTLTLDTGLGDDIVDENQSIHWQLAKLNAQLRDGAWHLNASTSLTQNDLAATGLSIQGNAAAQLTIAQDQSLSGSIQASLDDLAWTQAFVRELNNPRGSLASNLTIAGTLAVPRINGTVSIEDASFELPALGISIYDLDTTIISQNAESFFIQGSGHSGDGILRFTSDVQQPFTSDWTMHTTLSGEAFELTQQDDIQLSISPDIEIILAKNVLDLRGNLLLPTLNITLTSLPESTINVSPDAVIVSQSSAGEVRNTAQSDLSYLEGLNINSELHVELGENAHFSGFGLNTQLEGELDISRSPNGAALTYGELRVIEGSYRIYSRALEIEHGKLLFFGSLTNPALDIRAIRQTKDLKVGLQMNGTLRKIRSQLFSTPSLPDSDIIAVMLTDRPFAEMGTQDSNALLGAVATLGINQGKSLTNEIRSKLGLDTLAISTGGDATNSSLTLGKYLTPSLFIRYGVGLFDTESVVSLDYTVSERVKIEAKSGNSQSVDLTYTVER